MSAWSRACEQHFGHDISDEERTAFGVGYRAAIEQLRSDECYYEVAKAKTSKWSAIEDAAEWLVG